MLKSLLQGKWFGHPLHSYLVHLPIGLYFLSLILDLLSHLASDGNIFVRGAYYTMIVATIAAVIAVFPGLADWLDIRDDHPAKQLGIYHMVLNLMLIGVYGVNIAVRGPDVAYAMQTTALWLGLSLLGVILLSVSGYIGGLMVFDNGIGAGRHRRRGMTPRDTITVNSNNASDGMAPLVPIEQLNDHQTLRVDVNGVIVAVAKVDGQVYAFQEFCTHRFGPLSEGCFKDGQVVCPWHKSRFDIRSGQVAEGPAKEDIRVMRTEVRDGQVFVELPRSGQQQVMTNSETRNPNQ